MQSPAALSARLSHKYGGIWAACRRTVPGLGAWAGDSIPAARRLIFLLSAVFLAFAPPASAQQAYDGSRAGDFDYYVLALSWSPTWCSQTGRARGSEQCDDEADFGWVLHGLWPQFEDGYPANCPSTARDPSRSQTAAMRDIMGTSGAAWYQWKKHGRCSGLSGLAFLDLSRAAYAAVKRPAAFGRLPNDVVLPADVVEDAFLADNPDLDVDSVTVTCRDGAIAEVRICLTKDLEPRTCAPDVARQCTLERALLERIR